ncbi:unnamed protein product, partial [Clonostachys rhizophaga]
GVLAYFDGQVAQTSAIITPNTIVSVLSTGSKVLLLSAAAGYFEIVADISRRLLRSIQLLFSQNFRGGLLVRLGALITLLTIALDPFAQPGGQISRALRYSLGKAGYPAWEIGRKVSDNRRMYADQPFIADADFALKAATIFRLAADAQSIIQQRALNCPGEACEFSKVASLAVCSRYNNITSFLERTEDKVGTLLSRIPDRGKTLHSRQKNNLTRFSLPNGLYLDNKDGNHFMGLYYMTTLGTGNRSKTLTIADINTLIWSQNIIKVINNTSATETILWPKYEVHASECALYYCAREYNFTFYNSTKTETSSSEIMNAKQHPDS